MTGFGGLLRHAAIIGAGMMASKLLSFFMIPVYTRYLSPTEYGIAQLVELTNILLGMLIGCGVVPAVLRFYFDGDTDDERNSVIGTAVLFTWVAGALSLAVLLPSTGILSGLVFGDDAHGTLFRLALVGLVATMVLDVPLSLLRAREQSTIFITVGLVRLALMLSLNIYFIVVREWGLYGLFLSGAVANGLLSILASGYVIYQVGWRFSTQKLRTMAAYGLPHIAENFGMFVLNYSDRFFLQHFATLATVGVYALGSKFGMVVLVMAHSPFWLIWSAKRFQVASRPDAPLVYARTLTYICFGYLCLALATAVFIDDLLSVWVAPDFRAAAAVVPVLLLASLFNLGYGHVQIGICVLKKTRYLAVVLGVVAAVNVGLNLALIPSFQAMGAAIATCVSFAVMAGMTAVIGHRIYPVPWEIERLSKMVGTAIVLYALSRAAHSLTPPVDLLVKGLLVAVFPVVLYLWKFFTPEERAHLHRIERVISARLGFSEMSA